jgi:hypothetical protein
MTEFLLLQSLSPDVMDGSSLFATSSNEQVQETYLAELDMEVAVQDSLPTTSSGVRGDASV